MQIPVATWEFCSTLSPMAIGHIDQYLARMIERWRLLILSLVSFSIRFGLMSRRSATLGMPPSQDFGMVAHIDLESHERKIVLLTYNFDWIEQYGAQRWCNVGLKVA